MKPRWGYRWRYYWGAWSCLLLAAVFLFESLMLDRLVWALFLPAEVWAGLNTKVEDDTLSEFYQWIDSWAKPGARWYQSWQGAVAGMVLMMGAHAGAVASVARDGVTYVWRVGPVPLLEVGNNLLLGGVFTFAIWGFLLWHFIRADKTG